MSFVKRRGSKKRSRPSTDTQVQEFIKKAMPVFIVASFILVLIVFIRTIFLSIPYFSVDRINVVSIGAPFYESDNLRSSELMSRYKGKNIFTADIKKIAAAVWERYPELRGVTVDRLMPNILEIRVKPRLPVAMVKFEDYYPVDSEGVLLPKETKVHKSLPVISGMPFWAKPKIGQPVKSTYTKSVLILLKNIKSVPIINKFGVQRIEIANIQSLVFYLDNGLEIRIGQGDFTEKLKKLEMILKDPNVDKRNLKYIDLRFKDAVLGLGAN